MGRPHGATLDVVASHFHLKLKYHNLQGLVTINAYLEGEKRIYEALKRDKGEGIAMKINVDSLTIQLMTTYIYPQRSD